MIDKQRVYVVMESYDDWDVSTQQILFVCSTQALAEELRDQRPSEGHFSYRVDVWEVDGYQVEEGE